MLFLFQLIAVLVCAGILLAVARAMPATIDPWIRWGVYALAALVVVAWILGAVGVWPAPWHYPLR